MPAFARRRPNLSSDVENDFASGTRRYCRCRAHAPKTAGPMEYLMCEGNWIVEAWIVEGMDRLRMDRLRMDRRWQDRRVRKSLPRHILCKGLHCLVACCQPEQISSAFCEG